MFYKPRFVPGARLGLEYQRLGRYNTNTANTRTCAEDVARYLLADSTSAIARAKRLTHYTADYKF